MVITTFALERFFVYLLFVGASMFCYMKKISVGLPEKCKVFGNWYIIFEVFGVVAIYIIAFDFATVRSDGWIQAFRRNALPPTSLNPEYRGRIFMWSLVLLTRLHCVINQRAQVARRGCIFPLTLILLTWAPRRQQHENRGITLFWNFYLYYLTTFCHNQEDHNVKTGTVCSPEIWSFLPYFTLSYPRRQQSEARNSWATTSFWQKILLHVVGLLIHLL